MRIGGSAPWREASLVALRRSLLRARVECRQATQRLRSLPDFLIVGAQRCGTTSLYRYLEAHPGIVPSLGKETQYFTLCWDRGEGWYRAHFPPAARRRISQLRHGHPLLAFEATPYYLFHPRAAARAAETVPEARIVALLRNPVDRAFSHYRHSVRRGLEPLSFEAALDAEPSRLAGEVERMLADPGYHSTAHRVFSYTSRGLYAEQLEEWFRHFPRERILVLRSEDLFGRSRETYDRVLSFLGLPPLELDAFPVHSRRPSAANPLAGPLRARLGELFRPHNERLDRLLGTGMGWDG